MFDASKEAGMIGVDPRHFEYLLDLQEGLCYMDGHCDRKLIFDPAQHSNKFVIISRCDTLRLSFLGVIRFAYSCILTVMGERSRSVSFCDDRRSS